jgi:hypothetical protein
LESVTMNDTQDIDSFYFDFDDTYDEWGVNTKNTFNTKPKTQENEQEPYLGNNDGMDWSL